MLHFSKLRILKYSRCSKPAKWKSFNRYSNHGFSKAMPPAGQHQHARKSLVFKITAAQLDIWRFLFCICNKDLVIWRYHGNFLTWRLDIMFRAVMKITRGSVKRAPWFRSGFGERSRPVLQRFRGAQPPGIAGDPGGAAPQYCRGSGGRSPSVLQGVREAQPLGIAGGAGAARPRIGFRLF